MSDPDNDPNREELIPYSNVPDKQEVYNEFQTSLPEDIKNLAKTVFYAFVSKQFCTNYVSLASTLAYQGFDPREILRIFRSRADADTTPGTFEIKDKEGTVLLNISKEGNFSQDLALFVLLFVTRGTNWEKIKKKTEDQWVTVFDYKVSKYSIMSKRPTTGYKKDDITIARLAACVPHWVVFFCQKKISRNLVDVSIIENQSKNKVPDCMKTNMLPPILMREKSTEQIKYYCYLYSYLLDRVINPKSEKKITTLVAEIESFYAAAHDSNFITKKMRVALCKNFNLLQSNDSDEYSPLVVSIGAASEELWRILTLSKDHDDFRAKTKLHFGTNIASTVSQASIVESEAGPSHEIPAVVVREKKIKIRDVLLDPDCYLPDIAVEYLYANSESGGFVDEFVLQCAINMEPEANQEKPIDMYTKLKGYTRLRSDKTIYYGGESVKKQICFKDITLMCNDAMHRFQTAALAAKKWEAKNTMFFSIIDPNHDRKSTEKSVFDKYLK